MTHVSDLMQKQVFSVKMDDQIDRVFFLFHYEKIRHVPVVDKGKVVGIVSDRDLYKALGPRSRRGGVVEAGDDTSLYVIPKKVKHIMRRGVITIAPSATLSEAATMMARKKIGAGGQVSFSSFIRQLAARAKKIRETSGCNEIELRIIVDDNKVQLRARPGS